MTLHHLQLILLAALANVCLTLSLKKVGQSLDTSSASSMVLSLFTSIWIWLGVLCGIVLLSAFIAAIRQYSLAVTYIAVTALAMTVLTGLELTTNEGAGSFTRLAGLGLIVVGLVLTAI